MTLHLTLRYDFWTSSSRSTHGLRDVQKSRRPWRDFQFSRSHVKITQLAIVWMNSLMWKHDESEKDYCGRTNTSKNKKKSRIDHGVIFSFKVTRESHVNGDSWNDFPDLNYLETKKDHRSSTTIHRIINTALKHDAFDVIGDIIGLTWHFKNILRHCLR